MKKLMALAATLAMIMVGAAPALAQSSSAQDQYGDDGGPGETVTLGGVIQQYDGASIQQYGTHGLVDEASGEDYALSSETVDLSEYNGERVTVNGTLVPGYEDGQVEGGPPLVNVTNVEIAGGETPEEPGAEAIPGVVLEVGEGSVLIEDAEGGQYDFEITDETAFTDGLSYIPENAPPRAPGAQDLTPGIEVQVTPAGQIAQSFPAQGTAEEIVFLSPWYNGDEEEPVQKSLRGVVTNIDDYGIVVSENPNLGAEAPGYCQQAINFSLTEDTEILLQQNGESVPASAEDLVEGQPVEVAYTEVPGQPEIAICPPQREADSVVIIDGNNDGDNGSGGNGSGGNGSGGNGSGGNGSGGNSGNDGSSDSGDSAVGGSDGDDSDTDSGAGLLGISTLPDTGGMVLPALGFGAALIAGGVLSRRLGR